MDYINLMLENDMRQLRYILSSQLDRMPSEDDVQRAEDACNEMMKLLARPAVQ